MATIRVIRNVSFGVVLLILAFSVHRKMSASGCDQAWPGGGPSAELQYCGGYASENEGLSDMEGVALGVCFEPYVDLYWYMRVGDFSGPIY